MKKLKHEAELVKAAIVAGMKYGEEQELTVVLEPTDSASEKNPVYLPPAGPR